MHPRALTRCVALLLATLIAACSSEPPISQTSFQPLDFSYLTPLPLNVASIDIGSQYVPPGEPPDASGSDPISPVQTLEQMAHQRLKAVGGSGQAVFVVNNASITRTGDTITGVLSVTLSVYPTPGARAAYAQATVTRQVAGLRGDLQAALYGLTRQLMDQMNVEFEFQVRRALGQWLMAPGATAVPVGQAPLQPPGSPPLPQQLPPAAPLPEPLTQPPPPAPALPYPLPPAGGLSQPFTTPPPTPPPLPYSLPPAGGLSQPFTAPPPTPPPLPYSPPPPGPVTE
jgi:hypothetical protein